ncbi:MAG: fructose-6-phosphate aldolase [Firmicutes bacterium]|nr:fructose-6-phosphate aldolase [Candidatus Colimorpha enterica]
MLYIVDTANIEKIKHCIEFYPVAGVTTNPTIISREHSDFKGIITEIKNIIGPDRMFHIQLTGDTCDEMAKEAHALRDLIGENLYVKIPISPEGLKATMRLHKEGFHITETAIFTQQQALVAAKAGADFVAPYVNRLDNIISDGVNVVHEIVELFKLYDLSSKVLAASFKTAEQVHKISLVGCHAATVNPDILDTLIYHPLTMYAIDDFKADWKNVYGEKKIIDMI